VHSLALSINEEIRSGVTTQPSSRASVLKPLNSSSSPNSIASTWGTAPSPIVRSGEGLLRRTRNLCLGLIEAVRDQTRIVDLKHVNRVLRQPHWRKDYDNPLP
jgi:hypothetical protein